ncbi:hypothetical protein P691DRAFT_770710, partial [Macrolepiota fuliginosa MF-IS2]
MNRTPPNLVYLTIYNPSLRSTGSPDDDDDEDAEEQAHILFYTSKETAVSRDRMLRQIGLAKALVSFAELFNTQSPLDTVHSQTRRMIMVSPEPNFWIHACFELAKAPRVVQDKDKGKSKDKSQSKGKEKEKDKRADAREGQVYDYEDGSVQDGALRVGIMRGYERFKLAHGSFTAILNSLGQEALGLQLERFWTPWAWSWSLEEGHDFGQHLGISLHPYFKTLLPVLKDLQDNIPTDELVPLLLSPSNIAPSTNYLKKDYPISLPLFLSSLIPPPRDPSAHEDDLLASSQATIKGGEKQDSMLGISSGSAGAGGGGNFLNMQAMDVRKWNWGGVLNFGRNSSKTTSPAGTGAQSSTAASSERASPRTSTDVPVPEENRSSENKDGGEEKEEGRKQGDDADGDVDDGRSVLETQIDQSALDDAISSNVSPTPSEVAVKEDEGLSSPSVGQSEPDEGEGGGSEEDEEKKTIREPEVITPKALPAFLKRTVHLQEGDDALLTSQRRVYFLLKGQWMLALIGSRIEDETELQSHLDYVASKSEKFFETVDEVIQEEMLKSMGDSLPSASKILQPLDVHIASTGKYTFGSKNFESKSGLLFEARALQDRDPEISEVFSRGQNPQHWHMARRTSLLSSSSSNSNAGGPGTAATGGEPAEVYMEVFRKESSLADVDNVMAGVVKSWKGIVGDVDGL